LGGVLGVGVGWEAGSRAARPESGSRLPQSRAGALPGLGWWIPAGGWWVFAGSGA
jgi:hypothetical protein